MAAPPESNADTLFENQIRPLLVENCIKCHGDKKAESSLRLDSRAALMQGGDNGPAIKPGNPKESLLVLVVSHQNDIEMPPEGELSGDQVAVLEKWIEAGAPWPGEGATASPRKSRSGPPTGEERKFWSFQPIADSPVPEVADTGWPLTPVDRFILARLEAKQIKPVASTDKHTLLRRVTFDLTGLPPTPGEIEAFVTDTSPDALSKVVERLLASPAYGERWSRHWLDVVRYADTAGETADYPVREAWKYRNYVIKSFNEDKPYDQFVREQVAGDLLAAESPPEKFAERVTATGFLAISRRFGFDSINYHHLTIQDTIDTTGQAFLGLSLGCARCHDHKYDPVSAADYYALYGIFASTKYAFPGDESTKRPADFPALIPTTEAAAQKQKYDEQLAAFDARLKALEEEKKSASAELSSHVEFDGNFELQTPDKPPGKPWTFLEGTLVQTAAQSPFENVYRGGAVGLAFPNNAANNAMGQAVSPTRTPADTPLLYFNADFRNTPSPQGGDGSYRFYLGHGPGQSAAVELFANRQSFFVRNGAAIQEIRRIEEGQWYNVQLVLNLKDRTFTGAVGKPGDVTPFNGKTFFPAWDGTVDYFFVDGFGHIGGVKPAHEVDNIAIRTEAMKPVAEKTDDAVPVEAIAAWKNRSEELQNRITQIDKETGETNQKKQSLLEAGPYEIAYAVAEGAPQNVKIQKRGEPTRPGDEVPRRWLELFGGDLLPAEETGSGRRQLADWLTRADNPLTARVIVNRIWQHHFGQGIVPTENDFGIRGTAPTHPELLDWLARRFMESGWSIKSLHRQIIASRVYQLSSRNDAAAVNVDPGNTLLWRFNRRRLDAEELRDALLVLGGKLDHAPGEGHPFPPMPTWGFSQHGPFAAVYDTNKRSVYLMTQRLKRHPYLALFDGADTNASTAHRAVTTVPTQALFVMNDPLMHEQAAGFARQLLGATSDAAERVKLAFRLAYGREATAEEVADESSFVESYRQKLAATGLPAEKLDELAWSAFARTLLASNEFVFVD